MPYKIAGQPGTWYEPGTRKGNATIAWRGQLPDGSWTEWVTRSTNQSGAQAHIRRNLEEWHRRRPPAAGTQVDLDTAAHHYKGTLRRQVDRDRADRIVRYLGGKTDVAALNQSHVTVAANAFRVERAASNARAAKDGRQTFPPPSTETVNREVTTPLRGLIRFSAKAQWRTLIELDAVKLQEGEFPSPPRPAAEDADVDKLLRSIDAELQHAQPKGKRQLNHRRHMASLRALFALVTVVHERGYRISEWLRWRWETVALTAASASILLSKPDRWVTFDMSPQSVAALGQMPALDHGRVFPWRSRAQVYKAVDRFNLHWRPHESRRSVVTAVRQATGSIKAAQEYVSHASINTTLRYERPDAVTPAVRAGGKRARSGEPGK